MKKIQIALCAMLASVGVGHAGTITWGLGAAFDVATSNEVSTTGTLVEAFNGSAATGITTVNTVDFTGSGGAILGTGAAGQLDSGGDTGDTAYNSLLNNVDYGGGGDSFNITIANGLLSSGSEYQIQVWYCDDVRAVGARVMRYGDGNGNTVDVDAHGGGQGQYAIGTFTADATSQTLSLHATNFGNAHIGAYQIRAIPEPATLGLVAAFGGGILFIRRRFML